jgi:hypothetical protein
VSDPSTLLQQLFNAGAIPQQNFGPESRYYGLPVLMMTSPNGDHVSYVARRFIPPPSSFGVLQRYRAQQGDRIDVVAAALLGNPLSYWQICDANGAADPDDVTAVPGVFVVVPLPAGVPGGQ